MSPRYLVRGELSGWFLFGRIVAAAGLATGLVVMAAADPTLGGIIVAF